MNHNRDQKNGNHTPVFILMLVLTVMMIGIGINLGQGLAKRAGNSTETVQLTAETEQEAPETGQISAQARAREDAGRGKPPLDVSDIVQEVMPSIVSITNRSVQEVTYLFHQSMEVESESSGSGIILGQTDEELLIATNYHVVEDAESLTVCFTVDVEEEEDAMVPAVVKGSDEEYDLSVVAVDREEILPEVQDQIVPARLGSSEDLVVGETAIAIGNALGYGQSVTRGIVSALDRTIEVDGAAYAYIQTDAAINFGNSGGALLDMDGNVIGINSAKAAYSGVEGMGYAIPIDVAQPILADLMNRQTREKADSGEQGYMGAYVQDISSEARNLYEIPNGVCISYVASGSPADQAGLQRGDIISRMDGLTITSADRFEDMQQYYRAGETIELEILRTKKGSYTSKTVEITFSEPPGQSEPRREGQYYRGYGRSY